LIFSPWYTASGETMSALMSALSSPRSPISVCARPIWPGGQSGEPWRLHMCPQWCPSRILSTPSTLALTSTARACEVARDRRVRAARRRPHWACRALESASVRALSVDRRRSALHLHARDATGDADDAPSARTNDRLRHCHAWWCTATAALAAHKSFVLEAAEAANLQRHTGEAGIL